MKRILIDENLPVKLKYRLSDYEVYTVRDKKWNGIKNGKLLALLSENNFDVFFTSDKNLQYQQNTSNLTFSILVLDVKRLTWKDVEVLLPKIKNLLPISEAGQIYTLTE